MRHTLLASAVAAAIALSGCTTTQDAQQEDAMQAEQQVQNILLRPSPLPYQTPEFDKLKTSDYEPAFKLGMEQHEKEIKAIAANPQQATFDNTVLAMENSGELLNRAATVFFNLSGIKSDAEIQRIEADIAPKLAAHNDDIFLNNALFQRVKTVYENRDSLSAIDQRLTEYYYDQFIRSGANLNDADKSTMRKLNERITTLQTQFSQNILASFKNDTILVTDESQLAGLSDSDKASLKAAAQEAGKEGYLITLVNTTRQPVLSQPGKS